jgi:hypothetical protein
MLKWPYRDLNAFVTMLNIRIKLPVPYAPSETLGAREITNERHDDPTLKSV